MQIQKSKDVSYPPGCTKQLTAHQRYMLAHQLCSPGCMLNNIPTLVRFPGKNVDPAALRAACMQTFRMHPSYALVHSLDEAGNVVLKYRPDIIEDIPVTWISEHDFLSSTSSLVRPFALMDSRLYHCGIYVTESSTYLFLDPYHTVSDGNSVMITLRDVFSVMNGESLKPDGYLDYLRDAGAEPQNAEPEEAKAAFLSLCGSKKYTSVPRFDRKGDSGQRSTCLKRPGMTQREWEDAAKKRGTTPNQSLVSACLAALSCYNGEENVTVNWAFHGRDSEEKKNMTGLLMGNLPVGVTVTKDTTISSLLKEVRTKCEQGKPCVRLSPGVQDDRPGENERITVLYQNFLGVPQNAPEGTEITYLFDSLTGQVNCFNVIADKRNDPQEQVEVLLCCDLRYYERSSLERFSDLFCSFLRRILFSDEDGRVLENYQ